MSPSGAVSGLASSSLAALAWLVALLCVPLGGAFAAPPPAAATPMVMVDAFEYALGDTLTVRGSGLEPGADYVVALTSPTGETSETTVAASGAGSLSVSAPLDEPGAWTVALSGPRVAARLGVNVRAGPGDGPGAGGAGADQAPGDDADAEPGAGAGGAPEDGAAEESPGAADQGAGGAEEGAAEDAPLPGDDAAEDVPEPGYDAAEDVPGAGEGGADEGVGVDEVPALPPGGALPGEAPVPSAQARGTIEVAIEQGDVVGRLNGVEAWRLTFGANSGETAGLLEREDTVLVGHGNHLLQVDARTGAVRARDRLPAQVTDVAEGEDGVRVTVRYARGATATFDWPPERPLPFDPYLPLFSWLRAEADVTDPVAQLSRDPTNPWLYLAAARQQPDRAETLRRSALTQARTFYEYGQLARAYMTAPMRDETLAFQAMNAALADFVERGYRGRLLLEDDFADAYGFPHGALAAAIEAGDREAADFWAPWLFRLTGDGGPEASGLLSEYAAMLQAEGDVDGAATWRERAAAVGGTDAQTTLERAAAAVGSTGWYGVAALLVAVVALRLTLVAKYWRAQTLTLRQRREAGRPTGRFSRALTLRYATLTEKLVVLLLFAAVIAVVALSTWVGSGGRLPSALGAGTLATPTAAELLGAAPEGPDRGFALAYAAQTSGDAETANALYRELPGDPDAMNNLGVLRGDPELFRLALELDPGHPEATFNLGAGPNPSRLMAAYRPDEPLLTPPDARRLTRALRGSPWAALGAAFTNPFAALVDASPIATRWLWTVAVVAFLAWVAWTVLSLFFPRPQAARNAPRTFLYHVLALLLPGSGLADELWGVLLLVPWSIFGIDLLLHLTGLGAGPALAYDTDVIALVAIYGVNTVAFVVEYASYRRRMRDLRLEHPELAAAYGLRP